MGPLAFVRDICLLPSHPLPFIDATKWKSAGLIGKTPIASGTNGYTIEVINTKLVSWHRTYTHDASAPARPSSSAIIQIEEWLPGRAPESVGVHDWKSFGSKRKYAFAWIAPGDNYRAHWSESTRRAFRQLNKNWRFRVGSIDNLLEGYPRSQVPPLTRRALLAELENHLRAHPETIEVLVAEDDTQGVVACLVSGEIREARQSYYLIGYFIPGVVSDMPMVGLVDFWYQRCQARGITVCNFGLIAGAHSLPWNSMIGYSHFKTRFDVHRVWTPGSYWRVTFKHN